MCAARRGGRLTPDHPLGPYAGLNDDRGYCGLDVPNDAPFDDDHVVFEGAL